MASIKEASRLIKRCYLANLGIGKGLAVTPMLSGQHGIGKSMIINSAAKELNGYAIIIEGGSLKEGEITGLPFASQNEDGSTEVRFTRYNKINKIWQLEKYYYEKAISEGFCDGKIKLDEKKGEIHVDDKVFKTHTGIDAVYDGEENKYKFGEDLPLEVKLQLIESGEIKPVLLFIDEVNRTELQTMKELMNIILNRTVNGYDLPWWVSVVSAINPSSQNSSYATNEMDSAQLDRFLKIKVHANVDDWIDYALDKGVNSDIVAAIATSENCFMDKTDKSLEDQTDMTPSPRSWEMVAYIYETINLFNDAKILGEPVFSLEEKKEVQRDLRTLMISKVGQTAASTILATIENKENNIKPQEILTGKEPHINPDIVAKFNRQKSLRKKCLADAVLRYIADHICEYEEYNKSKDAATRAKYNNFLEQIKEFVNLLDPANQLSFAKKSTVDGFKASDGKGVYGKIAKCFARDVIENLLEFRKNLSDLQ